MIVLVVHFSGLSKKALLRDGAHAVDILLEDYGAEKSTGASVLTSDSRAAFVEMEEGGHIGLVEAIGDRFITRILSGKELEEFAQKTNKSISVKYHDFTHPAGLYKFDSDNDISRVEKWLTKLKEE